MNNEALILIQDALPEKSCADIFELIDTTSKNLRRIQRQTVAEAGLTPPQYHLLHLLWQKDERPFKELAQASLCSRATITGIIDSLERKGFVTREPNPNDRRSLLATLTENGRKMQLKTTSLVSVYDSCCTGLAPDEYRLLGSLLEKLNASLDCL
jgi:DNA-binding MarR family transcriptional regulator